MWNYIRKKKQAYRQKIADEVKTELLEELSSQMTRIQMELDDKVEAIVVDDMDYGKLAMHVDYSEMVYNMDMYDIAREIDVSDIEIDLQDLAGYLDTYDIAQEIDTYEVASNMDCNEVASNITIDNMSEYLEETKDEIMSQVEDMINDAVDELSVVRG